MELRLTKRRAKLRNPTTDSWRLSAFSLLLFTSVHVLACDDSNRNFRNEISPTDTSIIFTKNSDWNQVSVIGQIANSSDIDLDDIVIEARYYDANGELIDTATDSNYHAVLPAGGKIAFRVDTDAAAEESEYSSHEVTITSASARVSCKNKNVWKEIAVSWAPFVVLVLVWIWLIRRSRGKSKKSYLVLIEEMSEISKESAEHTKRIAEAAEKIASETSNRNTNDATDST